MNTAPPDLFASRLGVPGTPAGSARAAWTGGGGKPCRRMCAAGLPVFLLLLAGCEERDESGAGVIKLDDKAVETTPEKMKENFRAQIQKALANAEKKKQDAAKKGGQGAGGFDPAHPQDPVLATSKDPRMVPIGIDNRKNEKSQPDGLPSTLNDPNRPGGTQVLYLSHEASGKSPALNKNTLSFSPEVNAGSSIVSPGMEKASEPEESKKPGFWGRLFGRKKDPASGEPLRLGRLGPAPPPVAPREGSPGVPGPKDSMLKRIEAEVVKQRAENESLLLERAAQGGVGPKATVVDEEEERKEPPGSPAASPQASGARPKDAPAETLPASPGAGLPPRSIPGAPPSEAEIRAAIEEIFLQGLQAKDLLARAWSFKYAAAYRRAEAVPYMLQELQAKGVHAALAAACLGVLGQEQRAVPELLLKESNSKNAALRQACAESLGRLRAPGAARTLIKLLKTERNYQVRSGLCQALGQLGDAAALPALKSLLADPDEPEAVKAQCGLALAQLGDPSGKAYLLKALSRPDPGSQLLGLAGLLQLGDPDSAGYLITALESEHEELWVAAVEYFPQLGSGQAWPLLKARLQSPHPVLRRRAALALGVLGSDDGIVYLAEALKEGETAERSLAAELLGMLQRRDKIPLLIEKLRDPQSAVRQSAAFALTMLKAKEALPALLEAARGAQAVQDLPPAFRRAMPDVSELMALLGCIRALNEEKGDLYFSSGPDRKDMRWPEYDRELLKRQIELLKTYQVRAVLSSDGQPVGVVLKEPNGHEVLYRRGEHVAASFVVRDLAGEETDPGKPKSPASVTLVRGPTKVTLIAGRPAEVHFGRQDLKEKGGK